MGRWKKPLKDRILGFLRKTQGAFTRRLLIRTLNTTYDIDRALQDLIAEDLIDYKVTCAKNNGKNGGKLIRYFACETEDWSPGNEETTTQE